MTKWITPAEMGERIACTARHVLDLIDVGEIRASNIAAPGAKRATWRIEEAEAEAYMRRRQVAPGNVVQLAGARR